MGQPAPPRPAGPREQVEGKKDHPPPDDHLDHLWPVGECVPGLTCPMAPGGHQA